MEKYPLTLDEGQLDCLLTFVAAGVNQLQKDIKAGHRFPDPVVHADITLDAFTRGPKLLALLEEHKALGPQPVYEEEEA